MSFTTYRPQSDMRDELVRGMPIANRVNDMLAKPESKRYRRYLALVAEQHFGEPVVDPADEYREKAKALLPRALVAYEKAEGKRPRAWRCYYHPVYPLAALPDAVEDPGLGITFAFREAPETYAEALETGITGAMERTAQAMMAVTGMRHWLFVNVLADPEQGRAKMDTSLITEYDRQRAGQMENAMLAFLLASRQLRENAA